MSVFPGATPPIGTAVASDTLVIAGHTAIHNNDRNEIRALASKIGTGASTPTSGLFLRGTDVGTSAWSQVILSTDVSGVLPVANGGLGQASLTGLTLPSATLSNPAISGTISGGGTYSSPILTTPTIADYTNATHTHATNAQGGQLNAANALQNTTVSASKLNTGATSAVQNTSSTTTSAAYTPTLADGLTTSVTVTIGVNGLAFVSINCIPTNNNAATVSIMSWALSGANTVAGSDFLSLQSQVGAGTNTVSFGYSYLMTGLQPGSTTFTLQYRVSGNTGTFNARNISVIPL